MSAVGKVVSALCVVVLGAGCAGEPRPTEELSRAKTLVHQSEGGVAQRYAAADVDQARNNLQAAEQAAADKKNAMARRRANEAAADAELATARGQSREAQAAAQEMAKSLETLREEAARGIPVTKPDL
jgi:Domain of unknown function (DUF4398)